MVGGDQNHQSDSSIIYLTKMRIRIKGKYFWNTIRDVLEVQWVVATRAGDLRV